jgi:hypothetical protein
MKKLGLWCLCCGLVVGCGKRSAIEERPVAVEGENHPAVSEVQDQVVTNSIGMKLALIPAGEFFMGSPASGKETLARTNIISPSWAHPAYAGDSVYARNDSELVCVSLLDVSAK